ncbi:MAG: radical SAM protein [Nanoarchaeota archaeon]|nr:radical SAM protein [Nanoarchaeota archaeon]
MTELKHTLDDLCTNLLITSTCNAGCSWCIANDYMKEQKSTKYMSDKNFQRFYDMLSRDKLAQVNILGGEPSLHPKALEFGKRIHELGIPVGFSTNGLWNPDFREKFEGLDYPMDFEVTFLGSKGYNPKKRDQIMETFEQLKGHSVSLGLILTSPSDDHEEHLDIAEKYGFDLRWAIMEPTYQTGQTEGYRSQNRLMEIGKLATKTVKEANERGIETWADLTVPYCAIENKDRHLFQGDKNDIQYKCPPFFDISTNLKIWRCLPMASNETPLLTDFNSFREAYNAVNTVKKSYVSEGVFQECGSCDNLETTCSGGPAIAKKLDQDDSKTNQIFPIRKGD